MHKQVCVKVNAMVDKEIAPLVEALNMIDGLETFESCQDWFSDKTNRACIYFHYGYDYYDWHALSEICFQISSIFKQTKAEYVSVMVEWSASNDIPRGKIFVNLDEIEEVTKAIKELAISISTS